MKAIVTASHAIDMGNLSISMFLFSNKFKPLNDILIPLSFRRFELSNLVGQSLGVARTVVRIDLLN